jgi:hypothetical protein
MSLDTIFVLFIIACVVGFVLDVRRNLRRTDEYNECDCDVENCYCDGQSTVKHHITQNVYRNRKGKRQKVGVIVSCNKKGNVKVGYSLCSKEDDFNSKEAYIRAGQRMAETVLSPPNSLKKDLNVFIDRCHRYYHGANIATYDGFTITNP